MKNPTSEFQKNTSSWLFVSIPRQIVQMRENKEILWQLPISTSLYGIGEKEGSFCTPTGWHHIAQKIGDALPARAILKGRVFTGEIWSPDSPTSEDPVLTRILWLAGDEPHNQNTFSRYIYFHGTHDEENIGKPASHGCIRLKNSDMIDLYEKTFENMRVYLSANDEAPTHS